MVKTSTGFIPIRFLLSMLRRTELLRQVIRTGVRKRVTAQFDFHFREGYSAPFTQVDIKMTNNCNLRCKMCAQWGNTGWHFDQPASFVRDAVPLAAYERMVDEVASFRPWMFFYGGEPFLHRDLIPLMRYMKKKGLVVTVVTNGTTLTRHGPDLVDMGVDVVMVSIDGPRETHDCIRALPGAFDRAVAGIEVVRDAKIERGSVKPLLMISTTVYKDNVGNLDEVFGLGAALGIEAMIGYYGYFQTEESCEHYETLMQEKLDTTPVSQRGWLWGHDGIDAAVLVDTVKRIRGRTWPFAYVFAPDLSYEDIPRYYREQQDTFGYKRCIAPWSMVEILPNGDVATCRDYPDYVVGNIKEGKLLDLWNNDRYRKFRAVLKGEGRLPVCSRCCGLMDW